MDSAAFQKAYTSLNEEQRKAVDTIEGPVMVIAGPGTGKTQILTLRIARILAATDVQPENILALTFTESGAAAMRNRLRRYIGSRAYRVHIHTFHGFAETLIRAYPDAYPHIIGGRPASELAKIHILESIIDGGSIKLLRPSGNPGYYIGPLMRMIATMKQEYITPDRLAEIIAQQEQELLAVERVHTKGAHKGKVRGEYSKKERGIAKNRELLSIYRQYEASLREAHLYDFEDMIIETVKALRADEEMLRDLQESYQYVLADEHQDVNGSQNAILETLCSYHEQPNVFVVGDEKQAIYRFQGASLENFLYFENVFNGTTTIALTTNYRSGQMVLDCAHNLIAVDAGKLAELRVPLTAHCTDAAIVERRNFSHQAVEDEWLVSAVQDACERGIAPEEIAIIVRTNREVEQLTRQLRNAGIAVHASADGDILTHPITETVCSILDAIAAPDTEPALAALLHGAYWNIPADDLVRVLRGRSVALPLASLIRNREALQSLGVRSIDAVCAVGNVLDNARRRAATAAPHEVLAQALQESGFIAHVMAVDPLEGGRVLRRLYDEIEALVTDSRAATLASVRTMISTFRTYNVALTAPYITTNTHAVRVMTAHKSKGLEFDTVFIPHLVDSVWGNASRRVLFDVPLARHIAAADLDEADDERRLLYVAMTRARRELRLSCAAVNSDGKTLSPSRLFDDIDEQFLSVVPTDKEEAAFDPVQTLSRSNVPTLDPSLFVDILKERGLSATSLNNYLASPWTYVYRNALRVPAVQPEHMLYGTALHDVLEQVTKHHTAHGALPSDSELKRLLDRALSRLPLSVEAYTRRHEQGFAAIMAYLADRAATLPAATREEFTLRVVLPTGLASFPEVTLTGKLDRLDLAADGTVLRVIDYKTGKPKTRNAIEGKTKTSDGAYKRQLIFYALLLSLYRAESDDQRFVCNEYVLSFVEPDDKGRIHEEAFTVTDEEIAALRTEIIGVVEEIVSGKMLTTPCDEQCSDYCHLARQLLALAS